MSIRNFALTICMITLFSCAGSRPKNLGVFDSHLAPCPASPNCVGSEAADAAHAVLPFNLAVPSQEGWEAVRLSLSERPRTTIVTQTDHYLHAECRSALFGFVDDLELHMRDEASTIEVRSASRLGYSDMGVNRRRVERLRSQLIKRGVVR
jgi:uncharacterized protein (DUF1499 family)